MKNPPQISSSPSLGATSGGGGFRTVLESWSGLAAIGAGILALATVLADWLPEDMPLASALYFSLFGLSTLLLAIALPGLHTQQAGRARRLGRAGFILPMIGLVPWTAFLALYAVYAAFPGAAFSVWWGSWTLAVPQLLFLGGLGVALVGIAVFGIATARANVLPRGAALMFALGWPVGIASGVLYALFFLPETIDNPDNAVGRVVESVGLTIFAFGLIGMGHALWAHGRLKKKRSKRLPELSRPYSSRSRMPRTGFADKTVWDWLQLLMVPIVLAVASFWFTLQQDIRQQLRSSVRRMPR